jgi:pimeloyl-ACP methyl ester carboxylesterase
MSSEKIEHILVINGWSAPVAIWSDFLNDGFESYSHEILSLDNLLNLDEFNQLINSKIKPGTLLIGWSLGGELALHYLMSKLVKSNQKDVIGFVLLQSTPCFVNRDDWQSGVSEEDFSSLQGLLEASDLNELVRRFSFLMLAGSQYRKQDRKFLASHYHSETLPSIESLGYGLALLKTFDLRAAIAHIDLPFIWILGDKDSLISPGIEAYESLISTSKNGSVKLMNDMGHFPCGQHADQVKEIIFQFMGDL